MIELSNGVLTKDLVVGKGTQEAKKGYRLKVRYSCTIESTHKVIMSECEIEFSLGGDGILSGWNIGLLGVKTGTKRIVYCPSNTAYGIVGCPPMIPPNSGLIFTFDIVSVKKK